MSTTRRVSVVERGFVGEGFADVPVGGEATTVVRLTRWAVVSFHFPASSHADALPLEIAEGDGLWRELPRPSGEKVEASTFDVTLRPGTYRWRVNSRTEVDVGTKSVAGQPAGGVLTLAPTETVVVDLPEFHK